MADETTPKVEAPKELTINLNYQFTTVGGEGMYKEGPGIKFDRQLGVWVFGPGRLTVNEETADDLLRRDAEYSTVEKERLESKEVMVDISKVTGHVLSGAGIVIPED